MSSSIEREREKEREREREELNDRCVWWVFLCSCETVQEKYLRYLSCRDQLKRQVVPHRKNLLTLFLSFISVSRIIWIRLLSWNLKILCRITCWAAGVMLWVTERLVLCGWDIYNIVIVKSWVRVPTLIKSLEISEKNICSLFYSLKPHEIIILININSYSACIIISRDRPIYRFTDIFPDI